MTREKYKKFKKYVDDYNNEHNWGNWYAPIVDVFYEEGVFDKYMELDDGNIHGCHCDGVIVVLKDGKHLAAYRNPLDDSIIWNTPY